jgi:hypothetical protein
MIPAPLCVGMECQCIYIRKTGEEVVDAIEPEVVMPSIVIIGDVKTDPSDRKIGWPTFRYSSKKLFSSRTFLGDR